MNKGYARVTETRTGTDNFKRTKHNNLQINLELEKKFWRFQQSGASWKHVILEVILEHYDKRYK